MAAEQLADRGLAVYALDLRGREIADGERFYVEKLRTMSAPRCLRVACERT